MWAYFLRPNFLRAWDITEADLTDVAEKAARASSMQANPLPLMHNELVAVLSHQSTWIYGSVRRNGPESLQINKKLIEIGTDKIRLAIQAIEG